MRLVDTTHLFDTHQRTIFATYFKVANYSGLQHTIVLLYQTILSHHVSIQLHYYPRILHLLFVANSASELQEEFQIPGACTRLSTISRQSTSSRQNRYFSLAPRPKLSQAYVPRPKLSHAVAAGGGAAAKRVSHLVSEWRDAASCSDFVRKSTPFY